MWSFPGVRLSQEGLSMAGRSKEEKSLKEDGNGSQSGAAASGRPRPVKTLNNRKYEEALRRLQTELVSLQHWVAQENMRIVVIFEGRDAAGKGGVIKRIMERLNPRICKVVALGVPTEKEKTQWYFQRYVPSLPSGGEIILYDRSWYNRAGVERVMEFCTEEEYREFLHSCPIFERMIMRSGIMLYKYWFSVSDEEQERRFQARLDTPTKRWKLSEMDLASRERWVEYSIAKDEMFRHTDIPEAPWYVVNADNKKRARLNCINHLLEEVPYKDVRPAPIVLRERPKDPDHERAPFENQNFVPEIY